MESGDQILSRERGPGDVQGTMGWLKGAGVGRRKGMGALPEEGGRGEGRVLSRKCCVVKVWGD